MLQSQRQVLQHEQPEGKVGKAKQMKEKKKMYRNLGKLFFINSVLCCSSYYFGFCLTYLSTIQSVTMRIFFGDWAATYTPVLIGITVIAAGIGALCAPLLMKIFTRKQFVLFINCGALIICGIIQINSLPMIIVCRIFQGLFIGCYMAITPIYINELTPIQIKGEFGAFTQIYVIVGIVVSYGLGVIFYVTQPNIEFIWRFMFAFPAVTIILQSFLMIVNVVPESPLSLFAIGKREEGIKILSEFNVPEGLQQAIKETDQCLLLQTKSSDKDKEKDSAVNEVQLRNTTQVEQNEIQSNLVKIKKEEDEISVPWKALFLGFQLPFMQQLSGVNMIVTEIGSIFGAYDPNLAAYAPLIANAIQLLATIFSIPALKYFSRKNLILVGNLSLGIFDVVMGAMFLVTYLTGSRVQIYVSLAFILLFMISYGLTIGPIVWLYVPQILPMKYVPIATSFNWLGCSICIIVSPFITAAAGSVYPVFFGFAAFTLFFFCFNVCLLIETKGLTKNQVLQKLA